MIVAHIHTHTNIYTVLKIFFSISAIASFIKKQTESKSCVVPFLKIIFLYNPLYSNISYKADALSDSIIHNALSAILRSTAHVISGQFNIHGYV